MHYFNTKLQYLLRKEINELYIMNSLKVFALSMISLFIPIFLLKEGVDIKFVFVYIILHYTFIILLTHPVLKFAAIKGPKHSIIISIPFYIVYFFMLANANYLLTFLGTVPFLLSISFLGSLSIVFYFMGFHIDFARSSDAKSNLKQLGFVNIIATFMTSIGPVVGAYVISNISFTFLAVIVIVILIVSIIPLFFSSEIHEKIDFSARGVFKKVPKKDIIAYFAEGHKDISLKYVWPVMLFLIAINIKEIGVLYSFSNLVVVIVTYFVGRVKTIHNEIKMLKIGTIVMGTSIFFRSFLKTLGQVFFVQSFGAISSALINLPFHGLFYSKSKTHGIVSTIFVREISLNIGRVFALSIILINFFIFPAHTALSINLFCSSGIILLMNLITKQ